MRNFLLAMAFSGICGLASADDLTVVIPRDDKPFTVKKDHLVRLIRKGIAGSKIEIVKIQGPVKNVSTRDVQELVDGKPIIGSSIKEFDLKPTGTGKAKVTIKVSSPQGDIKELVQEFEVE